MINKFKEVFKISDLIILLTVIQLITYTTVNLKNTKDEEVIEVVSNYKIESFSEINNSLKDIKDVKVLNIENEHDKWNIKISLEGTKDDVIKRINKLGEFNIYNYNIVGNQEKLVLTLDLYR